MKGRKPIYQAESLEIGQKIRLKGNSKEFANQYAYQFRRKFPGKVFKKVTENGKVFIERIS
jgi:Tfp pilus assembly protein PilF